MTHVDWMRLIVGASFAFIMFQDYKIVRLRRRVEELEKKPGPTGRCLCGRFLAPGQGGKCPRCRSKL